MASEQASTASVFAAHQALREAWNDPNLNAAWPGRAPKQAMQIVSDEVVRMLTQTKLRFKFDRIFDSMSAETARQAIAADVALRLASRGKLPREDGAGGYLYRVVSNIVNDFGRAQKPRRAETVPVETLPAEDPAPANDCTQDLHRTREALRRFVDEKLVSQARAGNKLLESFDRIWAVSMEGVSFDALVKEQCEQEDEPETSATNLRVRNRFHRANTDLRLKLAEELRGQLERKLRVGDRSDANHEQIEDMACWLRLTLGEFRDRSVKQRPPRHTPLMDPQNQLNHLKHASDNPRQGVGGSTTALSEAEDMLRKVAAFLDAPLRAAGPSVKVAGKVATETGHGQAARQLTIEEGASEQSLTVLRLAGVFADLSELYSQPFLLARLDNGWRFVPARKRAGRPQGWVVPIEHHPLLGHSTGSVGSRRAESFTEDGFIVDDASLPSAVLVRYQESRVGLMAVLTRESAEVQLMLPPSDYEAPSLPEVTFRRDDLQELEDSLLREGIAALEAGPRGALRAAATLVRVVGPTALDGFDAAALAGWLPQEVDRALASLEQAVEVVLDAIEPEDARWVGAAMHVLEAREELEGWLELGRATRTELATDAVAQWDRETRALFAALPYWSPAEASAWLLAVRGARGCLLEPTNSDWWLDLVWDLE